MIEVLYNTVYDFVEELKRDGGATDDGVLRMTGIQAGLSRLPIKHYSAVVTFVRRGQIVRLECYVGDLWPGMGEVSRHTISAADRIESTIKAVAAELGLDLRAGIFRHAGESVTPGGAAKI